MNNTKFIQKTTFAAICAVLCCLLWGSAFPCIKLGYQLFSIPSSDTASQNRSFLSLSQAAMIPCCLLSAIFYGFKDHFSVAEFSPYAVPAILGGITGVLLLKRLRPQLVNRLFAALVIWSGIKMILG